MRELALNPFGTLIEFVGWLLVLCRQSFSNGMLYRKAPSGNFLLLSIVCLITACDGNYFVWSSDGKLAAATGAKGLRISDGDGNISRVLYEKAGMFRWLPLDHQGLVVAYDYSGSWNELKEIISSEQRLKILEESARLKKRLLDYKGNPRKFPESAFRNFVYPLEAVVHLRASSDPDFLKLAERKWTAFPLVKVPVFHIKQVSVDEKSLKIVKLINKSIDEIVEIRVSPNGKYVACTKHENGSDKNYIEVLPILTFSKPVLVARETNAYPDWSLDSRSVFYTRMNLSSEERLLKDSSVREGGLFRSDIIDGAGKIAAQASNFKLCRVIFEPRSPVRVLADGKIQFVSREIRLPSSMTSTGANSLFAWFGSVVDPVFSRKDDVVFYDVSPEKKQCTVTLSNGALYLLNADGADVVEICNGKDLKVSGIFPQWRNEQEFSYGAEKPSIAKGIKPSYAVMISSRSQQSRELSKSWGKEAISEIVVHKDLFQEAMEGVIEKIESQETGGK